MGDFAKLSWAATVAHDKFPFLTLVSEWGDKRQHVAMYQEDMPRLVEAVKQRRTRSREGQPDVVEVDPRPGLRLAAACEGLANAIYGACDIAATFGNRAHDAIPKRFNGFCKKVRDGDLDEALVGGASNLEWYARVREVRTEWAHHSTIFIGFVGDEPVLVVKPLRRQKDRVLLPEKTILRVRDLLDWSGRAVQVVDRFGMEVYKRHILPKLDLDTQINSVEMDERGFPIIQNKRLLPVKTSIRDYLRRGGFDL